MHARHASIRELNEHFHNIRRLDTDVAEAAVDGLNIGDGLISVPQREVDIVRQVECAGVFRGKQGPVVRTHCREMLAHHRPDADESADLAGGQHTLRLAQPLVEAEA